MSEAQVHVNQVNTGFDRLVAAGRSLWLAGLGAAAEVEEGSRELFDRLVERGRPLEKKQKQIAEAVSDRAQRTAREIGKLVQDTVAYESRGMLKRLKVMTHEDVKVLSARLSTLSKKIDEYAARREAATAVDSPKTKVVSGTPKAARPRQPKATKG
jgi:poly(hydroxyalkanoate) granule-associated protein